MHSFTDTKGQQWDIDLVRSTLAKIHSRTGVDLLQIFELDVDDNLSKLGEFIADEARLIEILSVACERQMVERSLTKVDFGDLFKADELLAAADALCREAATFFQIRQRSLILGVLDTAKIAVERLYDTLPTNFDASAEADLILSELREKLLGSATNPIDAAEPSTSFAGGLPDASESTPTDIAFQSFASSTLPVTDATGITPPASP